MLLEFFSLRVERAVKDTLAGKKAGERWQQLAAAAREPRVAKRVACQRPEASVSWCPSAPDMVPADICLAYPALIVAASIDLVLASPWGSMAISPKALRYEMPGVEMLILRQTSSMASIDFKRGEWT